MQCKEEFKKIKNYKLCALLLKRTVENNKKILKIVIFSLYFGNAL